MIAGCACTLDVAESGVDQTVSLTDWDQTTTKRWGRMMVRGPDFVIGGAARSGTTSLYRWLSAHEHVNMAKGKEVRFFDSNYHHGPEWYFQRLPHVEQGVIGEASPRYLTHPEAPQRIEQLIPHVRMIFVLRDPTERAYSDYIMDRMRGRGPPTFEQAIRDPAYEEQYVHTGHYAEHIRRFTAWLPSDQIHVILFDDLRVCAEVTFLEVCRFLEIPEELNERVGSKVNAQVAFRSLALRRVCKRMPRPLARPIERANVRRETPPPIPEGVERRLREHFRPHNAALEELLGRELPWT